MLLRSSNPRMSRVVMTRAGRPDFAANGHRGAEPVGSNAVTKAGRGSQNHVLNKISIPVEIGGDKAESLATPILTQKPSGSSPRAGSLMPSGETEINDSNEANSPGQPAAPALSPNWSGNPPNLSVAKRMASRDESSSAAGSMYSSSTPTGPSPSGRVPISNLTFGGVHINDLPLQDLHARKRELKQQLKQYDMNFAKIHGRMPVKAEKEPIRHLYESYNALKARITYLEREGAVVSGPPMPYRRSSADRASLSNASTGSVGSAASDASSGDEGLADIHEPQRSSIASRRCHQNPALQLAPRRRTLLHSRPRRANCTRCYAHTRRISSSYTTDKCQALLISVLWLVNIGGTKKSRRQ